MRELEPIEKLEIWKSLPAHKEGHIGKYQDKIRFFQEFIDDIKPDVMAQTGLNAGHSAVILLENGSPSSCLTSFDIGRWGYENEVSELLNKEYGDRHRYINGDSKKTLSDFDIEIDFAFVDGDHSTDGCTSDMINFDRVLQKGGYMMIDDLANFSSVFRAVNKFDWSNYTEINIKKYNNGKYTNGVKIFRKNG